MREYIICYDITDPRRLGRIHRALKKKALPVQYSVFLFSGTPEQLDQCLARLEALMNPDTDDIRAYPLPQRGLRLALGPGALPGGILWGPACANGAASAPGVNTITPAGDDEEADDEYEDDE
jgi:CRISPR-associated protein Cas2